MDESREKSGCRQRVVFWASIAGILALVFTMLGVGIQAYQAKVWPFALGAKAASTPPACQGSSDDFQAAALDPKWTGVNLYPNASSLATYAITPGELRLTAPPNADLFVNENFEAPRILQRANGNFTIETTVELNPSAEQFVPDQYDAYQGAGLLLWQDESTFVRLEQGYRDNQTDVELLAFNGNLATFQKFSTQATDITLKMQRHGDTLTSSWLGSDGKEHVIGAINIHFLTTEVGLALVNNSHEAANVGDSATFSNFSFSCI